MTAAYHRGKRNMQSRDDRNLGLSPTSAGLSIGTKRNVMSNSMAGANSNFERMRNADSQKTGVLAGNQSRVPTNYSNAGRSGDSRPLTKNRSAYPGQILASKRTLKRSLEEGATRMGNTISGGLNPGGVFTPSGQRTQSAVPTQYRTRKYTFRGSGFPSQEFDSRETGLQGQRASRKGSDA